MFRRRKAAAAHKGWVFDSVVGFLTSPVFTVPVLTFIEGNCIVFDTEEENKLEYTAIHREFQDLVESLLENFLADIEIPAEELAVVLEEHPVDRDAAPATVSENVFRLVAAAEDFLVFKSIMVQKNIELEMQVRRMYESSLRGGATGSSAAAVSPPAAEDKARQPPAPPEAPAAEPAADRIVEDEDEQLRIALALSMAEFEREQTKASELEDEQLRLALEQSRLDHERLSRAAQQEKEALARAMRLDERSPAPTKSGAAGGGAGSPSMTSTSSLPPLPGQSPGGAAGASSPSSFPTARATDTLGDTTLAPLRVQPMRTDGGPNESAAMAWMQDALREAQNTTGAGAGSGAGGDDDDDALPDPSDEEARARYLRRQRDLLFERRTREREARLRRFETEQGGGSGSSGSKGSSIPAASPPPERHSPKPPEPKNPDQRTALRRIVAYRLRNEVIKKK